MIRLSQRAASAAPASRVFSLFLFLSVALILGWLLITLKFIFLPMLLALFATFLLSPPVEWLYKHRVPRPLGIVITLAAAVALCFLAASYISDSFVAFHDGFPKYEENIRELAAQAKTIYANFSFLSADRVSRALNSISLSGLVGGTLNSFFTIVGYTSVTLMFMLYFLPAFPRMAGKIKRAFPDQRGALLCQAMNSIGRQVQSYIWAKTVTSVITGAGVTIPCLLFGVDFAFTWGIFAALLNFVPTIGAVLSVIPPVLVSILQPDLGGVTTALWLAGVLMIIMGLTGNVMEPLILGQSVNLSPTASLLALFIWGFLWGTVGMLIAVPAMAMIKFTCDNIDSLKPIGIMLGN